MAFNLGDPRATPFYLAKDLLSQLRFIGDDARDLERRHALEVTAIVDGPDIHGQLEFERLGNHIGVNDGKVWVDGVKAEDVRANHRVAGLDAPQQPVDRDITIEGANDGARRKVETGNARRLVPAHFSNRTHHLTGQITRLIVGRLARRAAVLNLNVHPNTP